MASTPTNGTGPNGRNPGDSSDGPEHSNQDPLPSLQLRPVAPRPTASDIHAILVEEGFSAEKGPAWGALMLDPGVIETRTMGFRNLVLSVVMNGHGVALVGGPRSFPLPRDLYLLSLAPHWTEDGVRALLAGCRERTQDMILIDRGQSRVPLVESALRDLEYRAPDRGATMLDPWVTTPIELSLIDGVRRAPSFSANCLVMGEEPCGWTGPQLALHHVVVFRDCPSEELKRVLRIARRDDTPNTHDDGPSAA